MSASPLWGVIAAAGAGLRAGDEIPKQYHVVAGRSVLAWSLDALLAVPGMSGVMLAVAAEDTRATTLPAAEDSRVHFCSGGAERAASVRSALRALAAIGAGDEDRVLVHDAARPAVAVSDIERLVDAVGDEPDGGLLACPVRDTLKRADANGTVAETAAREGLWQAMTPQLFPLGRLRDALDAADDRVTDEAGAMERMGARPILVAASLSNIKYTYPEDAPLLARWMISTGGEGA
ncbi:MAG: 2-C-methyl-D-erythritol 4-phosphate cytidylyltransferase [Spiribacter salinus]|uniref:2-C-methyl-D-erythritol 4-phosphate cytidylyltransferase n=1 Tax=Spiribacter salinus TaxID=1335746 RepID=A0A540VUB9_9GAMM|nr:2-C-methyl-D-erythritol 4-phosphate cytidylyltransferase [Spiribacter sp.]MDR9454976.1 2-C-methyl-D-erythritol 4-phosphate cytidylyltransferase [Spiribacter sp.]TQF00351.1 MAG: 2-C-methyl-D-erythritol 4-phosphate cytidylyltransferase [Spiribacter salinus]